MEVVFVQALISDLHSNLNLGNTLFDGCLQYLKAIK